MMWFLLFILLILIGVLMWFHRKSAQEWERELAYLMRHEQDERNQSVDLSDGEPEHRNVSVSPMLSNAREAAKSKQKAIETRELAEQLKESSLPAPRRRAQHQASDDLLPMFDGAEASAVDERHADVVDEREGDDEHGALAQDSDSADLAATPAVAKPVEVITFETATQLAAKVAAVKHKPRPMAASTPRETILLATQKQALIAPEANVHAYQAPTATKTKKYTVPHDDDALPVIGIDDIRVNLLKQRELRRRKSAEGQGPQPLVLPVIEAEEAFANLAHAKVPYSRGSTVVKQMVTRSSVIPSSARVVGPHVVAQTPTPVAVAPTPPISSRFTPFEHAPYTPPVSKVTAGYPSAPEAKPLASLLHSKATEDMAVGAASAATAAALATPVNVPSPMPVAIGRNSMVSGNDLVVDAPAWRIQDKLVAESAQPLIITPEPDEGASAPELLMHDEPMAEAEAQAPAPAPAAIVATKPALKTATALSFDMDEVLTPSAAALTAASLVAAEAEQARVASDDGAEEGMDFELDAVVEQSVATVFAAEAEQDVTPVFEVDVTPEMPVASEAEQAIALGFEAEAEQDFDPVFEVDVTPEMRVASEVEQAIALGFEDEAEQDFDPVFEVDVTPEMPVATEAEQIIDPRLAVEAESNMAVMADATAVQNGVEPVVAAGDTPERLAESVAEVLVAEEVAAVEASVLSSDSDAVYLEAEQVDASWEDDVPVIDVATDEDEVIEVEAVATAFAYATATEPVQEASFAEGDEDAADYVDDQALATPEEPEAATWAPKREVVIQPPAPKWDFPLPDLSLLNGLPDDQATPISEDYLIESGIVIEEKLAEFRVKVKVVDSYAGPVVTRHEIEPEAGVRGSQVVNLEKDLSRALGFAAIRVVETIPGKTCMGLELPNPKRKTIRLAEIFSSPAFQESSSKLTLALGQDITGEPIVTNLAKAPHLLVAGTTGSGKSVGVNAMILSLLFKATPEEVRLIMIDPKMLELSIYEGIPHLLAPVVTDMRLAANALTWCVNEMEKRYRLMSHMGVRNLAGFNAKVKEATARGESLADPFSLTPETPNRLEPLPFIVVVVDEFADLMMTAGKKIEELIARLAQKARAAGIHLILATQRPSVDVITGLIKANIPTRIAFQVSSKIDSRTILDQMGAESLLGMGDMLFLPPGTAYPQRIHGAFVADEEVHHVVEYLKQYGEPQYVEDILSAGVEEGDLFSNGNSRSNNGDEDPLYDEAVALVIKTQRASISSVQRQLRIGYNRAARLVEQMEQEGVVSAPENNGNRSVLALGSGDE